MTSQSSPSMRKQSDFTKLITAGYELKLHNGSTQDFYVIFHGPKGTIYEHGTWKVHVALPDDYPFSSPSIGFENKILHPNIDEASGSVCLDVINQTWTPLYSLVNIFDVFLPQLLTYPNPMDPLNSDAASLFLRDRPQYDERVKEYVKLHAANHSNANLNEDARNYPAHSSCSVPPPHLGDSSHHCLSPHHLSVFSNTHDQQAQNFSSRSDRGPYRDHMRRRTNDNIYTSAASMSSLSAATVSRSDRRLAYDPTEWTLPSPAVHRRSEGSEGRSSTASSQMLHLSSPFFRINGSRCSSDDDFVAHSNNTHHHISGSSTSASVTSAGHGASSSANGLNHACQNSATQTGEVQTLRQQNLVSCGLKCAATETVPGSAGSGHRRAFHKGTECSEYDIRIEVDGDFDEDSVEGVAGGVGGNKAGFTRCLDGKADNENTDVYGCCGGNCDEVFSDDAIDIEIDDDEDDDMLDDDEEEDDLLEDDEGEDDDNEVMITMKILQDLGRG